MKRSYNNIASNMQTNIVVALSCEAACIIDHYRLKKAQNTLPFTVFSNPDIGITLIVSGIGKIRVAAATSCVQMITGNYPYTTLLNFGIAGSRQHEVGDLITANKIIEHSTGKIFYPQFISKINPVPVVTHDTQVTCYPHDAVVDMEAFSFFQTGTQFTNQEQILVLKLISDNSKQSREHITPKSVKNMIIQQKDSIISSIEHLRELSSNEFIHNHVDQKLFIEIINRWHFTQYQQHQLHELIRRWHAIRTGDNILDFCQDTKQANEVINVIKKQLDIADYSW